MVIPKLGFPPLAAGQRWRCASEPAAGEQAHFDFTLLSKFNTVTWYIGDVTPPFNKYHTVAMENWWTNINWNHVMIFLCANAHKP